MESLENIEFELNETPNKRGETLKRKRNLRKSMELGVKSDQKKKKRNSYISGSQKSKDGKVELIIVTSKYAEIQVKNVIEINDKIMINVIEEPRFKRNRKKLVNDRQSEMANQLGYIVSKN